MAQQTIGIGATANDGTGDPNRTAFTKVNANFTELYGIIADPTLVALAAITGTGILVETATDTFTKRSIAGTASQITITNGDGVAGNPTASFPSTMSFAGKTISDLGAVTTADINGGTLDGAAIGGSTPAAGAFTTLQASGLITANGGQIKFPSSPNPSSDPNTLDDYTEWTATAVPSFATPGTSSWTTTTTTIRGTKKGRETSVAYDIAVTPTIGTGSGNFQVAGFPYTAAGASMELTIGTMGSTFTWPASHTQVFGQINSGSSTLIIGAIGSGQASTVLAASNMTTGGGHGFRASGVVEVS